MATIVINDDGSFDEDQLAAATIVLRYTSGRVITTEAADPDLSVVRSRSHDGEPVLQLRYRLQHLEVGPRP